MPWTAAHQASLSITNSQSLLKLISIELVTPSNYLILCPPPLLLSSIFPSIRVFSKESVLRFRWPKYWSFSFRISPSNEYSGLLSFRIDWFDLLAVQGTLKSSPNDWIIFFNYHCYHYTWFPGAYTEGQTAFFLPGLTLYGLLVWLHTWADLGSIPVHCWRVTYLPRTSASSSTPEKWDWVGENLPGVTSKFGLGVQNEAGQSLIEFCQENTLVIENTLFQQHKRRLYTWISPDGQHQNQTDYILCIQRWRISI